MCTGMLTQYPLPKHVYRHAHIVFKLTCAMSTQLCHKHAHISPVLCLPECVYRRAHIVSQSSCAMSTQACVQACSYRIPVQLCYVYPSVRTGVLTLYPSPAVLCLPKRAYRRAHIASRSYVLCLPKCVYKHAHIVSRFSCAKSTQACIQACSHCTPGHMCYVYLSVCSGMLTLHPSSPALRLPKRVYRHAHMVSQFSKKGC